ncbi:hypothetical protein [Streptomyces zagrosensis]|uniref:Uncharacterized protein n=1 Tax=Streptomyces zagrosensis TaxID=1042984 RepID=A0A7W9QCJ4_9ACTN|nr:hypothetical protein [Streptomyces zagrosensis]MBB5937273.1 hypothetical protein [Streptomyces zagrosensis]
MAEHDYQSMNRSRWQRRLDPIVATVLLVGIVYGAFWLVWQLCTSYAGLIGNLWD